jgi:hypothetical protein
MKKNGLLFGLLLLGVALGPVSGCFGKKSVTGPTWTTQFTMPLIMRVKNPDDPSRSGQIELGTGVNGLGEEGLNLTNSNSYTLSDETWQSRPLGSLEANFNAIASLDLSSPLIPINTEYTLPIPLTTPEFALSDSSYLNVTLSNTPNKNQIAIDLAGAAAGSGGLTVAFKVGGATLQSATIAAGQRQMVLSLAGKTLTPSQPFTIAVSGSLRKTAADARIDFNWSSLEAASFTVSGGLVSSKVDYDLATDLIQYSYDLPSELAQANFASVQLRLTPQIPANLVISGNLRIRSNLGQTQTVPNIQVKAGQTTAVSVTDALNALLANAPASLQFSLDNIQLSGTGDVTLSSDSVLKLDLGAALSVNSAATTPQGMVIDTEIDTDRLQTTTLVVEVTNYSPVALAMEVTLFPDNDTNPDNAPPVFDPASAVVIPITVVPNGRQTSEKTISTQQLQDLIRNKHVYHRVAIANTSSGVPVAPDSYLEIRSRAEGRVQINE